MSPTEIYKKLITDKCPPRNASEKVYASIIVALAERVETLEKSIITLRRQDAETSKAVQFLAKVLSEKEGINVDTQGADAAPAEAAPAQAEDANPIQDQTPFPAGVAAAANSAPAAAPESPVAEEIPQPDVGSGPAVNAAPIPNIGKKVSAKNGTKAEA